jgi:hypothetical protein
MEAVVVLGVYLLFLLVGMYSGQKTFSVEIFGPVDGAQLGCPPVELGARVTIRGDPASGVTARFTIHNRETGEMNFEILTDTNGVAKLVLPASSGNYTWHVSARKAGYPTIVTRSPGFSLRLMLVVDGLAPSPHILAVSPVTFKARVGDMNSRPVDSANVTFYVDSAAVGSSVTGPKGSAELSSPAAPGGHTWFASACKDGEGGISQTIPFLVGQAAALPTGELEVASTFFALIGSATHYPSATMMVSSSALKEKPRLERMT